MGNEEKAPWVTFLEHDVLWMEGPGGLRIVEVVLKIRHSGLLAVVKVRRGEERLVAFKGAGGIRSLAGKLRNLIKSPETKWREDEFV